MTVRRSSGSSTIDHAKDGSKLAIIPAGRFLAGGKGENEGGGDPFPVELPAYYLGVYPVTNRQYARFLTESQPSESDLKKWIVSLGSKDFFVRKSGSGYGSYGARDDHPVVRVTCYGAEAYCEWAGLRLPTELEWEKGARGTDGREFPWGNEWDPDMCRNANNRGNEQTAAVSGYPQGSSPNGLRHMSGNVWEWCSDWYEHDAYVRYKKGDFSASKSTKYGLHVVRGGSWHDGRADDFRCAHRDYQAPDFRDDLTDSPSFIGFRVAKNATP